MRFIRASNRLFARCHSDGWKASEEAGPVGPEMSADAVEFSYRRRVGLFAPDARSGILAFHRFATLAEALRFVVEELSLAHQMRAFIDVDDHTLRPRQIRALYDHKTYPLRRAQDRLVVPVEASGAERPVALPRPGHACDRRGLATTSRPAHARRVLTQRVASPA